MDKTFLVVVVCFCFARHIIQVFCSKQHASSFTIDIPFTHTQSSLHNQITSGSQVAYVVFLDGICFKKASFFVLV